MGEFFSNLIYSYFEYMRKRGSNPQHNSLPAHMTNLIYVLTKKILFQEGCVKEKHVYVTCRLEMSFVWAD